MGEAEGEPVKLARFATEDVLDLQADLEELEMLLFPEAALTLAAARIVVKRMLVSMFVV